jgi:peptidoglycan/xylan/chitin deacetylase (PgdA/CDA1 family)
MRGARWWPRVACCPGNPTCSRSTPATPISPGRAWPLLRKYGFGGYVILVSGRVGQTNDWDNSDEQHGLLDWGALAELRDQGVVFGAHLVTHRRMIALAPVDIAREAIASCDEIEQRLDAAVTCFAYPYGDHDEVVRHLVGAAGFEYGLTCEWRSAYRHEAWLGLPRIEVSGTDDLKTFIAKLDV